jgi:hypothetical protein
VDAPVEIQLDSSGLKLRLELAVSDDHDVRGGFDSRRRFEEELEAAALRQLADRTDDRVAWWNSETLSPPRSGGRLEAVIERHWEGECRQPPNGVSKIIRHG